MTTLHSRKNPSASWTDFGVCRSSPHDGQRIRTDDAGGLEDAQGKELRSRLFVQGVGGDNDGQAGPRFGGRFPARRPPASV
jgi:hypothetical protein